ncbi:MAG: single-stranded-DNA-specific exonuclease RecJ [Sandaracinaceae bacterium]|nr:single-stranded-DNA-specific exonuclease RecJ [Sandaracinaceae bacterium]
MVIERPGYRLRPPDVAHARALGRELGLGASVAQVLLHRNLGEVAAARSYLEPTLGGLSDPAGMRGRAEACERLAFAAKHGQRVAIFGDYDVDGTTSTAILSDVLEALGAEVMPFVANRFAGGYGFSEPALAACLAVSPDVIVTCDCGSSDHPRIAAARARGVDVIVVDHHLVPEEPLPALAFLNPHQPGCEFPFKWMCSAGLAFTLGAGVRAALGSKLDLRPWLDLVALGTVADVMPLEGDNRRLVRAGLRLLGAPSARPGIAALRENARVRPGTAIGGQDIAFKFGPRLNAAGRLADPMLTLQLLRARSPVDARMLAGRIEQLNDERKAVERAVTEQAVAQARTVYGDHPTSGIVVAERGWHRGVVGISAARLVERFGVPAVVIALDEAGVGHGSGRTPDGYHLHDAFSACRGDLLKFGGHAMAAGLSMDEARLDALRAGFAAATPRRDHTRPLPLVDVEVGDTFALPSATDLQGLEPLGEGNPSPLFALAARVIDARAVGDGQHLKLTLRAGGEKLTAFQRDGGPSADSVATEIVAVGTLSPDHYRGGGALELSVQALIQP